MERVGHEDNEATPRERPRDEGKDQLHRDAKDGAREPAPGEANPLSRPEGRPGDRRESAP